MPRQGLATHRLFTRFAAPAEHIATLTHTEPFNPRCNGALAYGFAAGVAFIGKLIASSTTKSAKFD